MNKISTIKTPIIGPDTYFDKKYLHFILSNTSRIVFPKYDLDGGHQEKTLTLNQKEDTNWEIYYIENGKIIELETFELEQEACCYFLVRLIEIT